MPQGIPDQLQGQRFARLLVLRNALPRAQGQGTSWVCLCDCGRSTVVRGYDLTHASVLSCGCYRQEQWARARERRAQKDTAAAQRRQARAERRAAHARGYCLLAIGDGTWRRVW